MPELIPPAQPRALMRRRARSFHLATLFLPRSLRADVRLVYAYYRMVDDLVDDPPRGWTQADLADTLDGWRNELTGRRPSTPIVAQVLGIAERHGVPPSHLTMVLDGATLDLTRQPIETVDDLRRYSVLVAGSVGMVMARVLGATNHQALQAAEQLGVAMQITNVLRDVGEDWQRERLYLPRCELRRAGYPLAALDRGEVDDAFRLVMRRLSAEARRLYGQGLNGVQLLPPASRFSVYLAGHLYARILDRIEEHDFDVFRQRAALGGTQKWRETARLYVRFRRQQTAGAGLEAATGRPRTQRSAGRS